MKVEKIKLKTSSLSSSSRVQERKVKEVSFQAEMRSAQEKEFRKFVESMLSEIDKQGEIFSEKVTFEELEKYKNLVKKFLQEVVARTYQFEKKEIVDRKGHQRTLSLVKKINSELEELTRITLQKQKDRLALLLKIGEIKGLLVDLIR